MFERKLVVKASVVIVATLFLSVPAITAFKEAEFKVQTLLLLVLPICSSGFDMPNRKWRLNETVIPHSTFSSL